MTIQLSDSVRDAGLDAFESTAGTSAVMNIYTGAQPANCAAANSGTELVSIALPSDWMAAASGGSKAKSGTWSASAGATGTAGHFRIFNTGETTCHMQGAIATSGSDLNLDNTSINSGQTVTISTFTLTAGNP